MMKEIYFILGFTQAILYFLIILLSIEITKRIKNEKI